MVRFVRIVPYLVLTIALSVGVFLLDAIQRFDRVVPRTVMGTVNLSGLSRSAARERITTTIETFLSTPIFLAARGQVEQVTLRDFGLQIDPDEVLDAVPFGGSMSNLELVMRSLGGTRLKPQADVLAPLSRSEIRRLIDEKFPAIPRARSAHFAKERNALVIIPEKKGVVPDIENLFETLTARIAFLETAALFVEFKEETPEISAADLAAHRELLTQKIPKSLTLTFDDGKKYSWKIDFQKNPEWIAFQKKPYLVAENDTPFALHFEPSAFGRFLLAEKLATTLGKPAEDVKMWLEPDGKARVEGRAIDGRAVEKDLLLAHVNNAIGAGAEQLAIPMVLVPAHIDIAPELQKMGVSELVATGYTRFEGSPVNRMHNVGVGVSKYNGLLIPPGEVFSFNDNLGAVDETTGFRKELVIKPEGTIPEYGGGLCQVSTTLYRAALYGGLPIVDRAPHSYAVSYYAQVGGHGLDATIYPPSRDFKFKNDTAGYLLIQSYVDGPSAYFKLYGTKDDRTVTLEGPYISNRRSAPVEPLLVPDPKLAPGQKKQVEKAHGGFDALWYRHLTKNGQTVKEEIMSKYKATQNKYLVGGAVQPEEEKPAEVNPFE